MSDLQEFVNNALMNGVDLTKEEYKERCAKADAVASRQGIEGKPPVSEAMRHKRIQSNFYGTALNFMANILCEIVETNRLLKELINKEGEGDGRS